MALMRIISFLVLGLLSIIFLMPAVYANNGVSDYTVNDGINGIKSLGIIASGIKIATTISDGVIWYQLGDTINPLAASVSNTGHLLDTPIPGILGNGIKGLDMIDKHQTDRFDAVDKTDIIATGIGSILAGGLGVQTFGAAAVPLAVYKVTKFGADAINSPNGMKLFLDISPLTASIAQGESVTFLIRVDNHFDFTNNPVHDATVYANGQEIGTSDREGWVKYTAYPQETTIITFSAKRIPDFPDCDPIKVPISVYGNINNKKSSVNTASDVQPRSQKLSISVSPTYKTVYKGGPASFSITVFDPNGNAISDATIHIDDRAQGITSTASTDSSGRVTYTSYPLKSDQVMFFATKSGYSNSDTVSSKIFNAQDIIIIEPTFTPVQYATCHPYLGSGTIICETQKGS
jgi:hypothetical protein